MSQPASGFLQRLPEPPRKVVVVRAPRIGDFICLTPALRALRAGLPEAEISLITLPMLTDLAERLASVDRVLPFPGFPGMASQLFEAAKTVQFFQNRIAERFDLALQMHGTGVYSNPFTLLLGARQTVGFTRADAPDNNLDGSLPFPASGHERERLLAMVDYLGLDRQGEQTEFPLRPDDREAADRLLAGLPRPVFAVHPWAHSLTRRWPVDRFVRLTRRLLEQHGGSAVVLAGPEQAGLAESVVNEVGTGAFSLAGKTTLPVTGAVLERCAALVSNDSGPAHIAYALRVPTAVIWGGEDLERYGPPADGPFRVLVHPVDCRPCHVEPCPIGYICLENIQVEDVISAVESLLQAQQEQNASE